MNADGVEFTSDRIAGSGARPGWAGLAAAETAETAGARGRGYRRACAPLSAPFLRSGGRLSTQRWLVSEGPNPSLPRRGPTGGELAAQREHQLALAQQIAHVGSWEWHAGSNRVTWSDELYRIYGLEPQSLEITLDTFLAKVVPADRERVQAEARRAMERGGRFSYHERIVRPDGSVRELDTLGQVLQDEVGRTIGLIGTCRDVTEERKGAEALLLYANIVQNVGMGLFVWKVLRGADPEQILLIAFNPAAESVAERSLRNDVGRSLKEILPTHRSELPDTLAAVAVGGIVRELPSFCFHLRSGSQRVFSAKVFPLPSASDAPGRVALAVEDVTEQSRARVAQAREQQILEMIASGFELQEILSALVLAMESQMPGTLASVQLLDPSGTHIRHGAAPNLPAGYNASIDGQPIGPQAGSCGTAAFLKQPVIVRDIAVDPLWKSYRDLALQHGLRACWSTPILSSEGAVLGTFALYYREPRVPRQGAVELIGRATHLAGIAIQRRRLEQQLRALSAHIEAIREDERTSVAREIHDELGQALTALKMDVAWLARRIQADETFGREAVNEKLLAIASMTDTIIDQVRRISSELRPGVLDDLGLLAAVEWQAQEFERRAGIPCVVRDELGDRHFARNIATAIFRIFQEALTNVARHARAARVEVLLQCRDRHLRLEVRDDGVGISAEAIARPNSLGLLGIRERASRLGGTATIHGEPNGGTSLAVEVPIPAGGSS